MTMPQMPRHTPTPWGCGPSGSVMREKYTQPFCIYESAKPNLICGCFGDVAGGADTARANAAFIVRAVNSHDGLMSALKDAQSILADLTNPADGLVLITTLYARAREAELKARTAIAQATPTEG